jgi:hypothetical protein
MAEIQLIEFAKAFDTGEGLSFGHYVRMVQLADGVTPVTGASLQYASSLAGASFTSPQNVTFQEVGSGVYYVTLPSISPGYCYMVTATGARPVFVQTAYDITQGNYPIMPGDVIDFLIRGKTVLFNDTLGSGALEVQKRTYNGTFMFARELKDINGDNVTLPAAGVIAQEGDEG